MDRFPRHRSVHILREGREIETDEDEDDGVAGNVRWVMLAIAV